MQTNAEGAGAALEPDDYRAAARDASDLFTVADDASVEPDRAPGLGAWVTVQIWIHWADADRAREDRATTFEPGLYPPDDIPSDDDHRNAARDVAIPMCPIAVDAAAAIDPGYHGANVSARAWISAADATRSREARRPKPRRKRHRTVVGAPEIGPDGSGTPHATVLGSHNAS